jgi:basic amino acid/polyamine antiporter, APA family
MTPVGPRDPDTLVHARTVGLLGATGIGVAATIGGGIFVLGGVAVAEAGPAAVLAFALNGVIALLTALSFAELATAFPENGGPYVYARRTFSVRTAFGVGWVLTLAHVGAAVLYALGFAVYAVAALQALLPGATAPPAEGGVRAFTLLLAVGATAVYGVRLSRGSAAGGQVENVGKLPVFAILIAAGLAAVVQRGPAEALAPLTPFFERGFTGVVAAMGFTFITLQGFALIAGVAGEVKSPRRTIPVAMFASLAIALGIYIPLMLVVTSVGIPPGAESAATFARGDPDTFFAVAASGYLGSFGFWLVTVAAILSTLSALRANLLAGSRLTLAMARHRTLPRALEGLHSSTRAPVPAIAFACISTALVILMVPGLAAAGAAASLIFLISFGLTHFCAWQVRRRAGGRIRGAFTTPLYPLVPLLGIAACGGLVLFQLVIVPVAGLLLLLWLGFGAFVYAGFLSGRAEALDAAVAGGDPHLSRLRGDRPTVLVPLANPARAGGLASVASALAPRQVGRIVLHQVVVAGEQTEEDRLRSAMDEGNTALSNALVRTRREGVQTDLLLTVAPEPWTEIARTARDQRVSSVLLGLAHAPRAGADPEDAGTPAHPIDRLMESLPCDVALLHAGDDFDLDGVRRVLVPLSGRTDHDPLRARVIGTLARKGLDRLTFLHVLAADASLDVERRALAALRVYVQDEARGRGAAAVSRAEDPIAEIVTRAAAYDLLVLGTTRPRGGRSQIGALLARMVRESPCPVLILSRPPAPGGRGARAF